MPCRERLVARKTQKHKKIFSRSDALGTEPARSSASLKYSFLLDRYSITYICGAGYRNIPFRKWDMSDLIPTYPVVWTHLLMKPFQAFRFLSRRKNWNSQVLKNTDCRGNPILQRSILFVTPGGGLLKSTALNRGRNPGRASPSTPYGPKQKTWMNTDKRYRGATVTDCAWRSGTAQLEWYFVRI